MWMKKCSGSIKTTVGIGVGVAKLCITRYCADLRGLPVEPWSQDNLRFPLLAVSFLFHCFLLVVKSVSIILNKLFSDPSNNAFIFLFEKQVGFKVWWNHFDDCCSCLNALYLLSFVLYLEGSPVKLKGQILFSGIVHFLVSSTCLAGLPYVF